MSNNKNSNLILGLIVCVVAVLFFVAGFLVSRLLNGGGDPTSDDTYYAKTETIYVSVPETIRVEHPVIIPSEVPQAVAQQPVTQQPVAQQPTAPSYRVTPRNLDLQVTYDGIKYYFSVNEWTNLSSSEKGRFTKRGLVINNDGYRFVIKLTVERHGRGYTYEDPMQFTWDEAIQWVNNMGGGWRLPDLSQCRLMTNQASVRSAIKVFGGDADVSLNCWTRSESNPYSAYCYAFNYAAVMSLQKNTCACVRLIGAL